MPQPKMRIINEVRLSGRTTGEINTKLIGVGDKPMTMAYFDIAQNYINKNKKNVMYFHCVAWNKVAEKLMGLPKGSQILIEKGQLMHSVYKKNGHTYNNVQVMVNEFIVLNENNKSVVEMEKELEQAEDIATY
jgi:single-stranded DNA-binding protein